MFYGMLIVSLFAGYPALWVSATWYQEAALTPNSS